MSTYQTVLASRLIGQYSWETYKTSYALKEHAPREKITCGTCKLIDNQITEPHPSKIKIKSECLWLRDECCMKVANSVCFWLIITQPLV